MLKYVLITPARNEEKTIEGTIQSVLSQTVKPERWIIISDGSTDETDTIIKKYAEKFRWIYYIRSPEREDRNFAGKASSFDLGYKKLSDVEYDIIGNLDADITIDADYFEYLLDRFSENKKLGVAGTPFREKDYDSTTDSHEGENHVAGGSQLFRKECYEDIGGYQKVRGGGVDWIAVTTARMKGWHTRSFKDKYFYHHRTLGTGNKNIFIAKYSYGRKDYDLGGHPLWELFRVIYQMVKKPYIIGGILILLGYTLSYITLRKRSISSEFIKFHRKEQIIKLRSIIRKKILTGT